MSTLLNDIDKRMEDEETVLTRDQVASTPPPTAPTSPSIKAKRAKPNKRRPIDGLRLDNLSILLPGTGPSSNNSFSNHAFNPFFSNIRQNMELCYGNVQDRFPVRLPEYPIRYQPETGSIHYLRNHKEPYTQRIRVSMIDAHTLPAWMRRVLSPKEGPKYMADCYEAIEREEQSRLQNVMAHHSKVRDNLTDHPFSMVASIEKGILNRYANIWPFEYNRVKLKGNDGLKNDYINASHIQYNSNSIVSLPSETDKVPTLPRLNSQAESCRSIHSYRKYIATQGPLPAAFNDFWSIVWDQRSRVIVMLTKEEEMNRVKCHQYWPSEIGKVETYGHIQVTLLSRVDQTPKYTKRNNSVSKEDVIIREFEIRLLGNQLYRRIHHIQYRGWHDYGVPDNPLGALNLISLVNSTLEGYEKSGVDVGPMIVHCSAGCGRTGAFCTIDTIISRVSDTNNQAADEEQLQGMDDLVFQTVAKFREQRVSMVQTLRQYVFCYEAILWWMLAQS